MANVKSLSRNVLHATVGGLELNADQKAQIKESTGVDLEWILFYQTTGTLARDIDPAHVAVQRNT